MKNLNHICSYPHYPYKNLHLKGTLYLFLFPYFFDGKIQWLIHNKNERTKEKYYFLIWFRLQELQEVLSRLLLTDLQYALDKKVEIDLWNFCFKDYINYLQSQVHTLNYSNDYIEEKSHSNLINLWQWEVSRFDIQRSHDHES